MIRDFWQERKDEKKRQKQLKKQNKKLPKTREQKAYKIFGVCFALFLIFGSMFYTCRGLGDVDSYSWDSLIGLSADMKSKLSTSVDRTDLIMTKQLDAIDWSNCRDALNSAGVGGVILSDEINLEILTDKSVTLTSTLTLDSRTAVVIGNNLPFIYVTTTSVVNILNNDMYCMNSEFRINNFSEEDNEEVLAVIDDNALVDIGFYTNELIARQINTFSEGVNAIVRIKDGNLEID